MGVCGGCGVGVCVCVCVCVWVWGCRGCGCVCVGVCVAGEKWGTEPVQLGEYPGCHSNISVRIIHMRDPRNAKKGLFFETVGVIFSSSSMSYKTCSQKILFRGKINCVQNLAKFLFSRGKIGYTKPG